MYNDYYLQSIDNKLSTTNSNLNEFINNQEKIIQNQNYIISGDSVAYNRADVYYGASMLAIVCILFCFILFLSSELVEHLLGIKRG